jgi:methylation protein MtfA
MSALAELDATPRAIARALDVPVEELYAAGADVYDALVDGDTTEIPELIAAARGRTGAVLELGCGSGRLCLPLLLRGHAVTAVDDSAAMLERFRVKAEGLPARARANLTLVEADMAALELGRTFELIFLATSTVTLLSAEQRSRALEVVRAHLEPGGVFVISTLDETAGRDEHVRVHALDDTLLTFIERRDQAAGVRHVSILVQRAGQTRLLCSQPRLVPEALLRSELAAAGFAVRERNPIGGVVMLTCGARS